MKIQASAASRRTGIDHTLVDGKFSKLKYSDSSVTFSVRTKELNLSGQYHLSVSLSAEEILAMHLSLLQGPLTDQLIQLSQKIDEMKE